MITILGPTASGKTKLAAMLSHRIGGEIISADSRQVYRRMDIGTGKDLGDYIVEGVQVGYHLIDITDPGNEYNIYEFRNDFIKTFRDITTRGKVPVLCGGSGMYLESVLANYQLVDAPHTGPLIEKLRGKSDEELSGILHSSKKMHNTTDLEDRDRMIKAILVAEKARGETSGFLPEDITHSKLFIFGVSIPRPILMHRISERLSLRLNHGLIDEIEQLLCSGIPAERLIRYGLEYKFVTWYLTGQLSRNEMETRLNIAIRQFAKRQMTWFKRMERQGIKIKWIDGQQKPTDMVNEILAITNIKKLTV